MLSLIQDNKHKASVEGTVGKIATAIIAKLRNESFNTLEALRQSILQKLQEFNDSPFQKREGSRTEVFKIVEKPYLRPLPATEFEVAEWVYGHKVNLDCHIAYKTNRYSVPYQYVGKAVDLKVTETLVEIYLMNNRLASHRKFPSYAKHQWSTAVEHMPEKFNQTPWDATRIIHWAESIGINTTEVINRIFTSVAIKEQGYNSALSVLKLSNTYSKARLETACLLALERIKSPRYKSLKAILSSNQDKIYLENKVKEESKTCSSPGYVRGPEFYRGGGQS